MRHALAAILVAALSTVAVAQDQPAGQASAWQLFEDGGRSGALVKADDGAQIVIKCDKPGRREVHAMILSGEDRLAIPNDRPISRPIRFQFDNKSPSTENWRFYEKYAMASGKTGDRALAHFIVDLRNATKLRAILDTGIASPVEKNFDVTGAKEAIAHVYEACRDNAPA
jgi:hypothetical protein